MLVQEAAVTAGDARHSPYIPPIPKSLLGPSTPATITQPPPLPGVSARSAARQVSRTSICARTRGSTAAAEPEGGGEVHWRGSVARRPLLLFLRAPLGLGPGRLPWHYWNRRRLLYPGAGGCRRWRSPVQRGGRQRLAPWCREPRIRICFQNIAQILRKDFSLFMEFFISMSETIKYNDDDHKTVFLKTLNEQRLEGEFCDIAIVVEDVKFRAHRCVLAACSTYFKKLFKKLEVDSSSVIEIDFLRSDIFEEVLNYMYTAKISVKKEDVNLMMSSGQILGIRFLDKLCSQKRDVSSPEDNSQSKNKYCLKINRPIGESNDNQDDEVEEIGDHDDSPSDMTMEGTPPSQEDGKSPTATLRVQEAILKELGSEEVRKVNCYGQEVESIESAETKELGSQTPQALAFNDGISEVKDEQTPAWTTAAGDMKFEYLLYGHREQIACPACGKTFSDEARLRKHEKLHTADRPFVCEMCTKGFTTQAHLKEHLKIHTGYKPYSCEVCGKSFIRAPDLKKHERVHSNERPFACHMCDKAFKHKSHLKDHERRHRGEKPFVCSSCTKAFAKASDLKRHENNMHSERKQVTTASALQSETEQLQAAAMAAEAEQQLETIACS